MSQIRLPGPMCRLLHALEIDAGTLCRSASPSPGPVGVVAAEPEARLANEAPTGHASDSHAEATTYRLAIAESEVFGKGKFANAKGNTECVEFVRQASGAPQTALWRRGLRVKTAQSNEIARGTAIATFDDDGLYPSDDSGRHAAIYLHHSDKGVTVLDQWNGQGEVLERVIRFDRPAGASRSNNGDTFHVIEVRN